MSYNLEYTGPQVDEAIKKILNIEITENGCIRIPSTEQEPVNLDQQRNVGYYLYDYYTSANSVPFSHHPLLVHTVYDGGVVTQIVDYMDQIYHRSYENNTWSNWSSYTGFNKILVSSTTPDASIYPEFTLWINTLDPTKPKLMVIVAGKWVELVPSTIMTTDVYDPNGIGQDIYKYIDDAIASADIGTITTDFETHIKDATIHVTKAEKDDWNSRVTNDQVVAALATLDTKIQEYVTAKVPELSGQASQIATDTAALNTKIDEHIAKTDIHPTPAKQAEWDSKAAGDHEHKSDDKVEIDASKVVSGELALARIPKSALVDIKIVDAKEDRFALTKADVQNGDTVFEKNIFAEIRVPLTYINFTSIVYANGKFTAIGQDGDEPSTDLYLYESTDRYNWAVRKINPSISDSNPILCYVNNLYLVLGANGLVYSSPDSITWTNRTIPNCTETIRCITYGSNGTYVACGTGGKCYRSSALTTWVENTSNISNDIVSIACSNTGVFAALAINGNIIRSTDGAAWTVINPSFVGSEVVGCNIIYADNRFNVAIGAGRSGQSPMFSTSTDGLTWNDKVWMSLTDDSCVLPANMIYANGKYIMALGWGSVAYTSDCYATDSWTRLRGIYPTAFSAVAANSAGDLVLVGLNGVIATTEGRTSSDKVIPVYDQLMREGHFTGAAYIPPYYAVYGDMGFISVTKDFKTWGLIYAESDHITKMCNGNGITVALTDQNSTYYFRTDNIEEILSQYAELDMHSWLPETVWATASSNLVDYPVDIAFTNGFFFVAANNGNIVTSADANTWTATKFTLPGYTVATNGQIRRLAAIDNKLYVLAKNYIAVIANPTTSPSVTELTPNLVPHDITFGRDRYVLYCSGCIAITTDLSSDVSTWKQVPITSADTDTHTPCLTFNNDVFVYTSKDFKLMMSEDGEVWTDRSTKFEFPYLVGGVVYANKYLVMPGAYMSKAVYQYSPSSSFYYVVDDTKLDSEDGYLLYSSTQVMSLVWDAITDRPTTVSGYGITDVYTKTEVSSQITTLESAINEVTTQLATYGENLKTLTDYTDNTNVTALTNALNTLATALAPVAEQHAKIVANATAISEAAKDLETLTQ